MNKKLVIKKIIDKLGNDLEILYNAARASHSEATHESSKAENKYDTRGLEAGYLAQGQMKQAEQIEQSIAEVQKLPLAAFESKSPIAVGALVEVTSKGNRNFYFVSPRGGGIEIEMNRREIIVLTPQAPLGQLLMGKKVGDRFKFGQDSRPVEYCIESVV
jgi:transcription elongation GreA/GreB family factor